MSPLRATTRVRTSGGSEPHVTSRGVQELRPIAQQHNERDPYGCYFVLRTDFGGGEAEDAKLQEGFDQEPTWAVEASRFRSPTGRGVGA
ncbi:hypothetical protein DHEL01_v212731 [Diaporthe helianthi]|uniref:Uncharacterized protein n=1 Tax=Diaporthe helianthi TaxID=158607 RepID=A0A2P5HF38_DIAHE|nr:hypothetical protein DHEL01_v212731 [Diaporthe helianthi]